MAASLGIDSVRGYPESRANDRGCEVSSSSSSSVGASNFQSWGGLRGQFEMAGALWLVGFKEACKIHRAISFCKRSRPVLIKTGQCFLLNGCLFLGSIMGLQHVIVPILRWILGAPLQLAGESGHDVSGGDLRSAAGVLQTVIVGACYVFWLYPLYIISVVVNIIWYNDIAKHAFQVMKKSGNQKATLGMQRPRVTKGTVPAKYGSANPNSSAIQSTVLQIGEQIYSVIMVSVFFLEVFAVSYIPYFGPLLNFVLLSWLYAYYCFDYKWGFARWSLERRLIFFETNWAFFAGFGSPCVLATYFLSPFVGAGVMNSLFPLFVLVATASTPEEAVLNSNCRSSGNSTGTMRRLPIFYVANNLTVALLWLLQPAVSNLPSLI